MWGSVRVVQFICFLCAAVGVVFLILLQMGYIKFETVKMYERHFNNIHEPPEYVEGQFDNIAIDDNETNAPKGFAKFKMEFFGRKKSEDKDVDKWDNENEK